MQMPLRAWKKTWTSLGFAVRDCQRSRQPRERRQFRSEQLEPRVMLTIDDAGLRLGGAGLEVGPLPPAEDVELVSPVWPPEIYGSDHMVWPEPFQDQAGEWLFPAPYFDPSIILAADLPSEGEAAFGDDGPALEQGGLGDGGPIGPAAPDESDEQQVFSGGSAPSAQPQSNPEDRDLTITSFSSDGHD